MKTILILCGTFPPTNIVGSLRPYRLTKELLRQNWRVIILTNSPRIGWELDESLLQELEGEYQVFSIGALCRQGVLGMGIPARVVGTVRDVFRRLLKPDLDVVSVPAFCKEFKKIVRDNNIDVFLTTSPPHSIHLVGMWIKKKYQLPWIVDYRDPWEHYPTTGHLRLNNPLERFWESRIAHSADALVSTTQTYTENLKQRHPDIPSDHFLTLTNTFDSQKTFRHIDKNPDKFIICYTGIFYPEKDPYGFFRALKFWFDRMDTMEQVKYKDKFEVHLIGSRDRPTRETIERLNLEDNVIFYERMPHDQAIGKTLGADMLLISSGMGGRTRPGWLPSKLFEYLGCRIPIIALTREGEMAEVVRKTNSGYVFTKEDHEEIVHVLKMEIDKKLYKDDQNNSNNFTFVDIDNFEEKNVMKKFVFHIDEIYHHNNTNPNSDFI